MSAAYSSPFRARGLGEIFGAAQAGLMDPVSNGGRRETCLVLGRVWIRRVGRGAVTWGIACVA